MDNAMNRSTADAATREAANAMANEHRGRSSGAGREPDSLAALIADLWRQTTRLVQEEASLAKAELSEKATHALAGAGAIAIGGAVLFGGFIVLLLAAVNALLPLLPPDIAGWLAPALVGLVVIVIGYVMVAGGVKALMAKSLAPSRTVESLRQDSQMVKEHV